MILYFLRHASAGKSLLDPKKDEKRPLDHDGTLQCGYIGRALAALDVHPDAILSSPLKRALQTASLVANEVGHDGKVQVESALGPEGKYEEFLFMLKSFASFENVMVVGHDPNLSEFLGRVIGGKSSATNIEMKKGAVARVEMRRSGGILSWTFTPKIARTLQGVTIERLRPKISRK